MENTEFSSWIASCLLFRTYTEAFKWRWESPRRVGSGVLISYL